MSNASWRPPRSPVWAWRVLQLGNLALVGVDAVLHPHSLGAWVLGAASMGLLGASIVESTAPAAWATVVLLDVVSLAEFGTLPAAQTSLVIVVIATTILLRGGWPSRVATAVVSLTTLVVAALEGSLRAGVNLAIDLALAGLAAGAMADLVRALRRVQELRDAELQRARADERLRLARQLHDTAAQHVALALRWLELAGSQHDLAGVRRELTDALEALRRVDETGPGRLGEELARARRRLLDAGIEVTMHLVGLEYLDEATASHLAWILREGVANVVRHAAARAATIQIAWDPDQRQLDFCLSDDGRGPGTASPGDGLHAIARHAAAIGARWSLAAANPGTRLTVTSTRTTTSMAS